eukprot:364080-Chlamydomonas_euryale.AAC.2
MEKPPDLVAPLEERGCMHAPPVASPPQESHDKTTKMRATNKVPSSWSGKTMTDDPSGAG